MLRTILPLAILGPWTFSSTVALAAPPPHMTARLEYHRGPGTEACEDESGVRHEVARRSGYDPFTADARARVVVKLTRRGGQILGAIQFYDDAGAPGWSRVFPVRANDCATLLGAIGAEVDFQFSPHGLPPLAPVVAPIEVIKPTLPEDPPTPIQPVLFRFGLGAALGFGTAPRVALGVSGDVGIYWPLVSLPFEGVSLTLGGRWDPPAAGQVPGLRESERVGTSRLLVTLAPCAHWWKLYGCALGELGQLRGGGDGVALVVQHAGVYSAVGGRLGVEVPFAPRLGFRISGEILGTVTPIEIPLAERPGWSTPTASGGFGAGLYLFF
jgi:hypothetical protein